MEKGTNSNITVNQLEVTVKNVLAGKGFELVNYRVKKPKTQALSILPPTPKYILRPCSVQQAPSTTRSKA